jgi:hypothetical protein
MTPRPLTGQEDIVLFNQHDEFTGGSAAWLRPRLRLDPQVPMVDLFDGPGLQVAIDDELLEDLAFEVVLGPSRGLLCSYDDDDIIGGHYDLYGDWVESWAAELRWSVQYLGPGPHDFSALALRKLREGMESWEPDANQRLVVTSPHLSSSNPGHLQSVLALACNAGEVVLNDVTIR